MADVTNYTIENNSGANVRTDLNNVFSAIQSSNSKSSDLAQSQCVAGMPFLNTTSKIFKIRNSSNSGFTEIGNIDQANLGLLSKAGGTMTGALLGDDSSGAAAPAFSFDSDTDLGLFRKAANIMGFSSSGTEQMIFDANGITLNDENEIRFSEGTSNGTNYVSIKAPSSVASNRTLTLPDASGTLALVGSSTVTIGSTSVGLGSSATAIGGLTELTSTTVNATNVKINNIKNAGGENESTADQIYEGRAKIWVNFNGTNTTIRDDFGVTSVGDHGVGIYQLNFDSSFSNTNYCPTGFVHRNGSTGGRVICHIDNFSQINVSSYRFTVSGTNNAQNVGLSNVDVTHCFIAIHGDQ